MEKWLPKRVLEMEEFLPEDLNKLRNSVKKNRRHEIAYELHVFEERVLFSNKDKILPWTVIGTYEDHLSTKKFLADPRHVKKLFLQGWMEVQAWKRGGEKKQVFYETPNVKEAHIKHNGQFIKDESTFFSIDCMKNFFTKYLKFKSKKRQKKRHYMKLKHSISSESHWYVFVSQLLWKYYYDHPEKVKDYATDTFTPINEKMTTLKLSKKFESTHATIANFDSWQFFLDQLNTKEGDIMTNQSSILKRLEDLKKDADNDPDPIPENISEIIDKISIMRRNELDEKDNKILTNAAVHSPKIQLAIRKAQLRYLQGIKKGAYLDYLEQQEQPALIDKIKVYCQDKMFDLKNVLFPENVSLIKRPAAWLPVPICIMLLWVFINPITDPSLLEQSYHIAQSKQTSFKYNKNESNELSFASTHRSNPEYRAFTAGLWQGKNDLIKTSTGEKIPDVLYPDNGHKSLERWSDIQAYSFYYQTAKWCFLTNTCYDSEVFFSETFWEMQLSIVDKLLKDFNQTTYHSNEDKRIILKSLNTIKSILMASNNFHLSKKQRRLIRNEAFILIKHFSI
ncbi:hypothetical protein MHK_010358 [Candidatus Magnetomorum sp. HK-1]|nr:hypothetical protein MHK_010358 [Candidatus Magnetomorum sp. HK-1]